MSKGNVNFSGAGMGGADQPYLPFGNSLFAMNPGTTSLQFQNSMQSTQNTKIPTDA